MIIENVNTETINLLERNYNKISDLLDNKTSIADEKYYQPLVKIISKEEGGAIFCAYDFRKQIGIGIFSPPWPLCPFGKTFSDAFSSAAVMTEFNNVIHANIYSCRAAIHNVFHRRAPAFMSHMNSKEFDEITGALKSF